MKKVVLNPNRKSMSDHCGGQVKISDCQRSDDQSKASHGRPNGLCLTLHHLPHSHL
jgi:hypothetical protein